MMSDTPQVSVLMTIYNREKYLSSAIKSVLAQTYKNFELVLVDDGSKDRSVEIAKSFTSDPRVRFYQNEKNLGDYPNRQKAASLARSKYIKYCDSDDMLYPHALEAYMAYASAYPDAGLVIAHGDAHYDSPLYYSPENFYKDLFINKRRYHHSPLNALYKKEALEKVGGFGKTQWHFCGDYEMSLAIARYYSILVVPNVFAFYRVHENQIISQTNHEDNYAVQTLGIDLEALDHAECPLKEEYLKAARLSVKKEVSKCLAITAIKYWKPIISNRIRKRLKMSFGSLIQGLLTSQASDFPSTFYIKDEKKRVFKNSSQGDYSCYVRGDDLKSLRLTLDSLALQIKTPQEIYISDSFKELVNEYDELTLYTGSYQKFINESTSKWLRVVKADTVFCPWAFLKAVHVLEQHSSIGINFDVVFDSNIYPLILSPKEAFRIHFLNVPFMKTPLDGLMLHRDLLSECPIEHWDDSIQVNAFVAAHVAKHGAILGHPRLNTNSYNRIKIRYEEAEHNRYATEMARILNADLCPMDEQDTKQALKTIKNLDEPFLIKDEFRANQSYYTLDPRNYCSLETGL